MPETLPRPFTPRAKKLRAGGRRTKNAMTGERKHGLDWGGVNEQTARTILEQGDRFLQAQLTMSLASDQRAMVMATIMVAFASALLVAGFGYLDNPAHAPLATSAIFMAVAQILGAWFCIWSARPLKFAAPGSEPKAWWNQRTSDLALLLGGEAENHQLRIEQNECVMAKKVAWLRLGTIAAVATPLVGIVAWYLWTTFPSLPSP